jgi:hypothetical protein
MFSSMCLQNAELYKIELQSTAYTATKLMECPAHDTHKAYLFILYAGL